MGDSRQERAATRCDAEDVSGRDLSLVERTLLKVIQIG
jgi:hypothetical protein